MNEDTKEKGGGRIDKEKQIAIWLSDYQNLVFTLCYKMTNNYFEAEDLAQETFLAAYAHLEQFDGKHEKAWLCRIAVHKCLDFLKKDRRRVLPQEETVFLDCVETETVEGQVLENEVKQELQTCCESLPSPYKEVAISYFCDEKEVVQIAEEQNRNIKTVQTQIYRARAKLQKLYGKGCVP